MINTLIGRKSTSGGRPLHHNILPHPNASVGRPIGEHSYNLSRRPRTHRRPLKTPPRSHKRGDWNTPRPTQPHLDRRGCAETQRKEKKTPSLDPKREKQRPQETATAAVESTRTLGFEARKLFHTPVKEEARSGRNPVGWRSEGAAAAMFENQLIRGFRFYFN